MMDVKYSTQAKIADASREYLMNKAAFDQEVNTKKAEAELAYELQVCQEMNDVCQNKFF
jgi:flotillin